MAPHLVSAGNKVTLPRIGIGLVAVAVAGLVSSCTPAAPQRFELSVGMPGKDVSWHPTPPDMVERMLDIAKVAPRDVLIDLGSGDGRIVIAAARRGARALGIESNRALAELAVRRASEQGVADRASFVQMDLFEADLSPASVITLYLLTELNLRLREKVLMLEPGTRVVSYAFRMGDWEPDEIVSTGCGAFCTAYMWIVPAQIAGDWQDGSGTWRFAQAFQTFEGIATHSGQSRSVAGGRIEGARIAFAAGGATYEGRVSGGRIEGVVLERGAKRLWLAERVARQ